MQPLPRSLDPLSDESLPGYLLRLAHRLGLTPSQLAARLGMAPAGHCPPATLLHLPAPARAAFATAARLTPAEAGALCLGSLGNRYPLPAPDPTSQRPAGNTHPGRWVLAPATRYCPACLAGDGTQIQNAHGGCWRRSWHLPVAFACPRHHQLLSAYCPGCGHRVHHGWPGAHTRLLPSMGAPGLHPAQCRTAPAPGTGHRAACCGTRLDTPGRTPTLPAGDDLLDLQQRILDLLHTDPPPTPTSGGQPTTATGYFTDLRLLALLICSSWPATRHLAPSPALADAVEAHAARQRQQAADLAEQSPSSKRLRILDTPPPDAATSAGLLSIADQILALPGPGELREHLRPLLPATTRQARGTAWGKLMTTPATACSAGLHEASAPLLRSFTRSGGHRGGRREPALQPTRLGPRHIPAFLLTDWYDRHFSHLSGISTRRLRRTATVRIVQMISGGSMSQAAAFLEINPGGTRYRTGGPVHSWARTQPDPNGFDTALHTLAEELDSTGMLVDYQHRRAALRHWCLDEPTWQELASHLPPTPETAQPVLDDRKREGASLFVWTLVTQGEHLFAPRPIQAAQPEHAQHAWAKLPNAICCQLSRPAPLRHYIDLRNLLIPYARQLAANIDRRGAP